jgi:hypothetical protein
MSSLLISGRGLARRQKVLFDGFSVPFPPDVGDGDGLTLRELITRIAEVISKVLLLARDREMKDPNLLAQIRSST